MRGAQFNPENNSPLHTERKSDMVSLSWLFSRMQTRNDEHRLELGILALNSCALLNSWSPPILVPERTGSEKVKNPYSSILSGSSRF